MEARLLALLLNGALRRNGGPKAETAYPACTECGPKYTFKLSSGKRHAGHLEIADGLEPIVYGVPCP
ncbi:MAG: hypothetical protein CMO80_05380 [Verrucomicrobiales bacterium]|nr:hypothetical protein [Verrucomicrobiales bacterium]